MKNDLSVREYVQKPQVFMYVNPMHTKGQKLKPELAGWVSFCFETKKLHVTRHSEIHPHMVLVNLVLVELHAPRDKPSLGLMHTKNSKR